MSTNPKTISSAWARFRAVAYLRGRGLSLGVGSDPICPDMAKDMGKYSLNVDFQRLNGVDIVDQDFSIIAKSSLDHVFIGNRINQFTNPDVLIKTLVEKLKEGGHLVVYLVEGELHEKIADFLKACGYWQEKAVYHRDTQMLGIWKLVGRQRRGILPAKPKAAKRACICRYGAIGDMIMISPLIRQLHEDGYEVTMNVTPYCADILKNNPYVDNVVLQERDAIPNMDLGPYWAEWMPEYDKYINLSESIEGKLIKVEGRRDFYTSKEWRTQHFGHTNYYDQTMRLGGYPDATGRKGELYFSKAEEKDALFLRNKLKDKFFIIWALKGSSYHKVYPLLADALGGWLDAHPDAHAMLCGAAGDERLAFNHPRVMVSCGQIPLRAVLALTRYADLVGGPETAITNAAACWDTPKITLLSHSSHDNLCKYWTNDYCLAPENVECYPCHQLHYNLESCPLIELRNQETGMVIPNMPVCAGIGVSPSRLQARLDEVYNLWKASRRAPVEAQLAA